MRRIFSSITVLALLIQTAAPATAEPPISRAPAVNLSFAREAVMARLIFSIRSLGGGRQPGRSFVRRAAHTALRVHQTARLTVVFSRLWDLKLLRALFRATSTESSLLEWLGALNEIGRRTPEAHWHPHLTILRKLRGSFFRAFAEAYYEPSLHRHDDGQAAFLRDEESLVSLFGNSPQDRLAIARATTALLLTFGCDPEFENILWVFARYDPDDFVRTSAWNDFSTKVHAPGALRPEDYDDYESFVAPPQNSAVKQIFRSKGGLLILLASVSAILSTAVSWNEPARAASLSGAAVLLPVSLSAWKIRYLLSQWRLRLRGEIPDVFVNLLPAPHDPLISQHEGQARQRASVARLKYRSDRRATEDMRRTWLARLDLDMMGAQNSVYDEHNMGLLEEPKSPDVLFYKKSIFMEMRALLRELFTREGWDLSAGVGGDEMEATLWGAREHVSERLDWIFYSYSAYFNYRYAFFAIEKNALTQEEVDRLRRMPGALVLTRSGQRFILTVDISRWGDRSVRKQNVWAEIRHRLDPEAKVMETGRYGSQGPFTLSLGAISIYDALGRYADQYGPSAWKILDPDGRLFEKYVYEVSVWASRMAGRMLDDAKSEKKPQRRFEHRLFNAFEDSHLLINIPHRRKDIFALRTQMQDQTFEPVSERDPSTGLLTANQWRKALRRSPYRYIYLIGISSWHAADAGQRALHLTNKALGQDSVSRAITAFAGELEKELGTGGLLARLRSDKFLYATDENLAARRGGFFSQDFIEGLPDVFQKALRDDGDLRPDAEAYIQGIDPVLSVYAIDTEAVSAWRAQPPEALRLRGVLNPIELLDEMALAELTYHTMPWATAEAQHNMDLIRYPRYFVGVFNGSKLQALRGAAEKARELQREVDATVLADHYKSLDERVPMAQVTEPPRPPTRNIFKRAWRWLLGLFGYHLGAATLVSSHSHLPHEAAWHAAALAAAVLGSLYFLPKLRRFFRSARARDAWRAFAQAA